MVQSAILWFQGMTANVVSSLLEGNLYHLGNLYSSCRSWETHNIPAVFRLMLPAATSPLSLSHSIVPFIFFFLPSLISFVDSFLHFFPHLFNPFSLPMSFQFISVTQSCLTLCDPMDCSTQASLSITNSQSFLKLMTVESVMPSNHLILCRPLLFLPSIFPSIRVFSNESVLCIRRPKNWSFSFSISPSNEYSGLISFRMDWLDLLAA